MEGGVRRIISLPLPLPRICTCISWIALAYMMSAPCTFRVSKCFLCNKKPSIFILHLNISKVRYQLPILKYIYYKFVMHSVSIQYIHVHVSWVFDNQSRNIVFLKREGEDKTTQNLLKPTNLKTKTKPSFANHQNPDECSLPIPIWCYVSDYK